MARRLVNLASDNAGRAAPEIVAALAEAAAEPDMPYGEDRWTRRLGALASEVFEREVAIFPVATGTAANALALATVIPPWGMVFCHEAAHIEEDECAAPEFYAGGAKLSLLGGAGAKFSAADLRARLDNASPAPPVHRAQPAAASLTQATEAGAVYRPEEVAEIAAVCREHGLALHMDGARLANAAAALGCAPADVTWRAGVDILSLGATKNGALAAEAVVFFDPARAGDFEFRRKRGGHLFSKMRFMSAQLVASLEDGRWLAWAAHANAMAAALAGGLAETPGVAVAPPVEANMLFLEMPEGLAAALGEAGCAFYTWGARGGRVSARMVAGFDTTAEDVAHVLAAARAAAPDG